MNFALALLGGHAVMLAVLGTVVLGMVVLASALSRRPRGRARRHKRKQAQARRVLNVIASISSPAQRLSYLRKIDPYTFEELLLEAMERSGHEVTRNHSYSGDGGIDGRVVIAGQRHLVQAKRYKGYVSAAHVREFAAMLDQLRIKGLFCHTGRTGGASLAAYRGHPYLTIVSGQRLLDLLASASHSPVARAPSGNQNGSARDSRKQDVGQNGVQSRRHHAADAGHVPVLSGRPRGE